MAKSDKPVRALRAWINAGGIRSGVVFRKIDRWGNVGGDKPMSAGMVARIIKDAALSPRRRGLAF